MRSSETAGTQGTFARQQAAVDQITRSIINKILHTPIEQLKEMAHDPGGPDFVDIVRKIFNIKSRQQ